MIDVVVRAAAASATTASRPPIYKAVGIILAVCSGLFIGTSFVLKKVGLLKANIKYDQEAGEGYGYLKNAWWWSGMTLMILGEILNFVAYSFTSAILVTSLGALSVVVTTILSAIFLKERLSFVGKIGCFNCIVGSVVIVLSSPQQSSVANIQDMKGYVISPGFLTYAGVILVGCLFIALWAGPRYGKKSMLVYLSICSLIGGLSVVATQGLGAAIVAQIAGEAQFNQWFLYVLLVFVVGTLLTEIIYLNKALNIFNAALVTPTYYVYFTSSTIVTSAILFRGFKGTPSEIILVVMGFLQICSGVVLLQLSKSAKDVPDTAVFTGDLDQVRTIAEQEAPESEPKADAIRGGAALIRSISKARLRKEAEEARRLQEERMEPIGENEQVEWDGLRRRKTIIAPGQSSIPRRKPVHPPLGMTHFPTEPIHGSPSFDADADADNESGLFTNLRRRAFTVWHPGRSLSGPRTASTSSYTSVDAHDHGAPHTLALDDMHERGSGAASHKGAKAPTVRTASVATTTETGDLAERGPHIFGLPPGLQPQRSASPSQMSLRDLQSHDTAYHSPAAIHFATPPPPPQHQVDESQIARRQFSFQNIFHRHGRGAGGDEHVRKRTRTFSAAGLRRGSTGAKQTEEERLGLVKGDEAVVDEKEAGEAYVREEEVEQEEHETRRDSDDESLNGREVIRVPKSRSYGRRFGNGKDDSDEKGGEDMGYDGPGTRGAFL